MQRFTLLIFLFTSVQVTRTCDMKDFLPCVIQLNAQKVPFDSSPFLVLFNITTEAKLVHSCKIYEKTFSCFDQKMSSCGTKAEFVQLERSKRLHTFLCAPFSLQRQRTFLKSVTCIQNALKVPATSTCDMSGSTYQRALDSCRELCPKNEATCEAKIKASEAAACTYLNVEARCGADAAKLYGQIQQVLTNKEYPIQCQHTYATTIPKVEKKSSESFRSYVKPSEINTFQTNHPKTKEMQRQILQNAISTTTKKFYPTPASIEIQSAPVPIIKTVVIENKANIQQVKFNNPGEVTFKPNPYTTSPPQQNTFGRNEKPDIQFSPWNFKSKNALPVLTVTAAPINTAPVNDQQANEKTPLKVQINWRDDPDVQTKAPWYQQTVPTQRESDTEETSTPVVSQFLNQLKSNPINLTELGNQANNYFSAAVSAFTEVKNDPMTGTSWRAIIDAVAPTIQRVSPDIIPRIKEEINRIPTE